MARRVAYVRGMKVRLPKGASDIDTRHHQALSALLSEGKARKDAKCTIAFFHARGGRPLAGQRCEGRKLKATNRRQCRRGGKGPKKHLFTKCR